MMKTLKAVALPRLGAVSLGFVLLGGALVSSGCARATAGEPGQTAAPQVTIVQPKLETIKRDMSVAGSLVAMRQAGVRSRINGYVQKLEVDIGSEVKAGDVLAFVAVPELDAELSVAKALAHVEQAKATGAQSVGRVSQKRWSRLNKLFKGDPDAVAADRVDAAETHAVRSRSAKETAQAMQQARMAELRRAEVMREYQTVRAPFDGVVTKRFVDVGDLVGPGNRMVMFSISSSGAMRARFALPEAAAMQIKVGINKVTIGVPAAPADGLMTATIARSSAEVDLDTRTVTFEADVEGAPQRWLPGLYANIGVNLFRKENALILPAKVLVPAKKGSMVWLCKAGKATQVPVVIGLDDGEVVEIIDGVKEGDPVVLKGKGALRIGGGCSVPGAKK